MLMLFVDCCWRCIFMCAAGSGGVNNFYCPARHSAKTRPHLDFYGVKLFICKRIKAATAAATNCHKMRSIIRFWPFYFVGFCFGFSSELRRPCSTGKISHNDQCPIIINSASTSTSTSTSASASSSLLCAARKDLLRV